MAWSRNVPRQGWELRALLENAGVDPDHWPWRRDTLEGIEHWIEFEDELSKIRKRADAGTAYEYEMHRMLELWRVDSRNPHRPKGRPKGTTTLQSLDEVREAVLKVARGPNAPRPRSWKFLEDVAKDLNVGPTTLKNYVRHHGRTTFPRFRDKVLAAVR